MMSFFLGRKIEFNVLDFMFHPSKFTSEFGIKFTLLNVVHICLATWQLGPSGDQGSYWGGTYHCIHTYFHSSFPKQCLTL